jgi:hypothetical protein
MPLPWMYMEKNTTRQKRFFQPMDVYLSFATPCLNIYPFFAIPRTQLRQKHFFQPMDV